MKSLLLAILIAPTVVFAQVYNNPGGTINTCSGTFYDTGGAGGQYGTNENITTTFCSTGSNCVRLSFGAINIDNGWHFITLYDGPNTSSPVIGTYTGTNSPGVVTSSSGCITVRFTSDGLIFGSSFGWSATISCVACPPLSFTHPTVGGGGEFVGSCLVNNCGPFTYTDNGGASGNYSNSINGIYRVFCPSVAGNCMQVTFNSFNIEAPSGTTFWDMLQVKNGPTQNSPGFTGPPNITRNNLSGWAGGPYTGLAGNLGGSVPFSFTSTDASGCLTFRFFSDGTVNGPGWNATLQCVPCAGGPNGTDNNDCSSLTAICGTASMPGNATGPGLVSDGCIFGQCPAGGENFTNWYAFQVQTGGVLNILVDPINNADDYDFTIYGPNPSCSNLGTPFRCSDAAVTGNTGTNAGSVDLSESAAGNGFVAQMNVSAGQIYYLVVDEWTPTGAGYTLSFPNSTANLDCTVLPVELNVFTADYIPEQGVVDLFWSTATERDNDFWEVERSVDGINWTTINEVKGAGTTNYETQYYVMDEKPNVGINYYRLTQWDINGNGKSSEVRSVNILDDFYDMLTLFPNPTNGKTEVIYNSYNNEQSLLQVVNADGKIVVNAPIESQKGGNRFELDMSAQERGVYVVTIVTRDKAYRTKLVKE